MPAKLSVLLLVFAIVSSGCAVISEEECRTGLWYERGVRDGARGRSQALVYDIAQECQGHEVYVDSEAWLRGHEEGVEQFCTAENGYKQGRQGRKYEGVCNGPSADIFMQHYQRGLAEYRVAQQYHNLLWRRDNLERELYSLHHALRHSDSDSQRRALHFQHSRLEWELRLLDLELHRYGLFGPEYFTPGFYPRGFFSSGFFYW
ncbi:DUF2799 domain-containing protein [Microbulbifer echini]|uniref:DUF2799 domain-containing protein n=1 Tax=Microbulbifer echini TaxID=1529067 RepID=A0ABV4NJ93_9GAMM